MPEMPSDPSEMSSGDLMKELVADASLLVKRQVQLARLEGERDLAQQKSAFGWLGAAGALGYAAIVIILTAAALAIGMALSSLLWAGALIVGAFLLLVAAIVGGVGYSGRVHYSIPRTRRLIEKEITWATRRATT